MELSAMSMNTGNAVQNNLNIGLMKESMVNTEEQATELMDKMLPQQAPSPYGFDTFA